MAEPSPLPYPPRHPWVWGPPLLALGLLELVWLGGFNRPLFALINGWSQVTGDALWANLTLLGDTTVAFALLLPFCGRAPKVAWPAVVAAVIATLWVHALKAPLNAVRPAGILSPEEIHIIGPQILRWSFPSGHTTTAFTLAGIFCLQRWPVALKLAVLSLAVLVALSRIVVGAHWPVDVLAGAAGGWLAAAAGQWLAHRWAWGWRLPAQRGFAAFFLLATLWLLFGHDSQYPQARTLQTLIALGSLAAAFPAMRILARRT